jgi:lipid-A-disaccharide synthase
MKIGLVAGEASGDVLGAALIQDIKARYPGATFVGIAGPKMQAAGCESLYPMETLSVMGVVEVLQHLPSILKVRRGIVQYFKSNPPDIFVGIDAPDFNLTVERKLKAAGVSTVHYVSPSIWAWREGRIHKIKKATMAVLTLFPFETLVYKRHQHPAYFVGHPLLKEISARVNSAKHRKALGLSKTKPVLALLPGSREGEVKRLLPVLLATAKAWCKVHSEFELVLPIAAEKLASTIQEQCTQSGLSITLVNGQSREVMASADLVLVASGTAAFETALFQKPAVVVYKLATLTYWIAKALIKLRYVSLPNILMNKEIYPECIQGEANAQNCMAKLEQVWANKQAIHADLKLLRTHLSQDQAESVVEVLEDLLG